MSSDFERERVVWGHRPSPIPRLVIVIPNLRFSLIYFLERSWESQLIVCVQRIMFVECLWNPLHDTRLSQYFDESNTSANCYEIRWNGGILFDTGIRTSIPHRPFRATQRSSTILCRKSEECYKRLCQKSFSQQNWVVYSFFTSQ